jgi:hypothetical protein
MKRFGRGGFRALCSLMLAGIPVSAQWLNYPAPGIPRLPDGRPNLSASAPRSPDGKPDLSGIWEIDAARQGPFDTPPPIANKRKTSFLRRREKRCTAEVRKAASPTRDACRRTFRRAFGCFHSKSLLRGEWW